MTLYTQIAWLYSLSNYLSFAGTRLGATPNTDFTLKQVEFTFDPSNVGESHCVTVQTLEDDYYEGEEIFGLGIFSDTPVTLEPQMEFGQPGPGLVTVYLQDNDGELRDRV